MCEKKTYSPKMKSLRKRISFRLDFFSLPSFKDEYLSKKGEISNNYKESVLSELERQIVDVDSVAYNLDVTLETIAEKKSYCFSDVIFDNDSDIKGKVIVNPYYLFIEVQCKDGDISEKCINKIKSFLFDEVMAPVTTSKFLTCQVDHYTFVKKDEIDSIIDKSAFVSIDTPINGRYSDEYKVVGKGEENIDTALIRYLQLYDDNQYDILVKTILSISLNDDLSRHEQSIIDRMISISEQETSRCFI